MSAVCSVVMNVVFLIIVYRCFNVNQFTGQTIFRCRSGTIRRTVYVNLNPVKTVNARSTGLVHLVYPVPVYHVLSNSASLYLPSKILLNYVTRTLLHTGRHNRECESILIRFCRNISNLL